MDPVLQRLGDVTIQRLEKPKEPKVGLQNDSSALEKPKEAPEVSTESEEESGDEFPLPHLKRVQPSVQKSMKRFKFDPNTVTLEPKKCDDINREIASVNNFSDTEMSDFDSESEIESESELPDFGEASKVSGKEEQSEEENSTSFLDKLVEEPFSDNALLIPKQEPDEDYDYDIKEKLKEMGEISFETVKKGEKPKKTEINTENEVSVMPAKKTGLTDEEIAAAAGLPKGVNMRRNIREVMDETKLDEATLAAQRQEAERVRRVVEQQRILREYQRQANQERMQQKVLSLLQGNNMGRPSSSNASPSTRIGNTVLVKLPNGQTKPMTKLPKKPFDMMRMPGPPFGPPGAPRPPPGPPFLPMGAPRNPRALLPPRKPGSNLTPSVSIAPVNKKFMPPMIPKQEPCSETDSEGEELKPPMIKPKSKDNTVIDISSDDDCIVVSEPEGDADECDDDPGNSGMHTNDEFNQPDEQGRVLVNVGHPENEPDVFVAPQIARIIKPHQVGGVRFLYDNVVESTSRFECSTGFGCILAHSMGLGKTLQIVCFSDIFLRYTPGKTVLCIMPINTLQNWMAEYNMWLPTEDNAATSPLNAHGEVRPRNFNLHVLNDSHKTLAARAKVIHAWKTNGGVLLIGYELFRLLSQRKNPKTRRKPNVMDASPDDNKNKALFDEVHEALVKPGPDLVICDEGHRIKNSHASISLALKQMSTKRRVVLTGYPLQNNLMEYWCMVDFVRPNYLGSKTEFCNMFERPIMNGQCIDSTEADIKLMRYRAHVLHSLLLGFVQRRSHTVLQTALPQKEEYVLLVRMTPFQRKLYETFMNEVVRSQAVPNPLKAFAVCCKIWNHPDVLYNFLKKRAGGDAVDIDLEEVAGAGPPSTPNQKETKPKRAPAGRRKASPRGKNAKPAASVTPYNSSSEPAPTSQPPTQLLGTPISSGPLTSFSNTISSQQSKESSRTSFSGTTFESPPTFPGNNYFDQHFDQNAQFPTSFDSNKPATTFQQTYPENKNQSTNFSEPNVQSPQSTFLNLDNQSTVQQQNTSFGSLTNLSSEISLTPVKAKESPSGMSQVSLTPQNSSPASQLNLNSSVSLIPAREKTQLNSQISLTPISSANAPSGGGNFIAPGKDNTSISYPSTPQSFASGSENFNQNNEQCTYNQNNYNNYSGYTEQPPNQQQNTGNQGYNQQPQYNPPTPNDSYQQPTTNQYNSNQQQPNQFNQQPMYNNQQEMHTNNFNSGNFNQGFNENYNPTNDYNVGEQNQQFNQYNQRNQQNNQFNTQNYNTENRQQQPPQYNQQQQQQQPSQYNQSEQFNQFSQQYNQNDNFNQQSQQFNPQGQFNQQEFNNSNFDNFNFNQNRQTPAPTNQENQNFQRPANYFMNSQQPNNYFNANQQPFSPNNQMIKSESSNDSKPKINIISDIKLPMVFPSPSGSDKKINILSDIKIDPKEEVDDKFDVKKEIAKLKSEMMSEMKLEEPKPLPPPAISPLPKLSSLMLKDSKEDSGIPYDWAIELLKDYIPGCIENSAKMEILFCIIRESIALGDRLLVFSQSLITLDLIEQFLQMSIVPGDTIHWARNVTYYRLDGSTSALEREKLINEFNSNPKIHLFLVSTRAGSLGINLIGANRVVVLDASWNPCHDTQAVCRVYRYGQRKPCFVYRLVVDNCLEKKIYDRQVNKQGMSDRIVDECNPDAHLTMKDVSTLCWDDKKDEGEEKDWSHVKDNYIDVVLQKVLERHGRSLNKEPFQHESLLVDRKEKQLSSQEKRLAKKGYEREKQAARQPSYNMATMGRGHRPVASVRPMQQGERPSRWIPAEHWQRQGMTAQEMTLPLDVVIPTNQPDKGNIVLKAGQKVLVLKSPKGVYMQLESGKIVAIKTAIKVKGKPDDNDPTKFNKPPQLPQLPPAMKINPSLSVIPQQKKIVKPFQPGVAKFNVKSVRQSVPNLVSRIQSVTKKVQMAKTKPYNVGSEIARTLKETESMPGSSSEDEHMMNATPERVEKPKPPVIERLNGPEEIQKKLSMLKNKQISIQRVSSTQPPKASPVVPPKPDPKESSSEGSALEHLEHTTSTVLSENTFQNTLDSITSNFKNPPRHDTIDDALENLENLDDEIPTEEEEDEEEPPLSEEKESQDNQENSDLSDEVTFVSDQPPSTSSQYSQQQNTSDNSKTETAAPEYNYQNNYYGYPPYHGHPPPPPPTQGYTYPPQHPPPYDAMGYPQPQQPPYNYGYQGYPPPPPQPYPHPPPPQTGYDYNAHPPPPQPMYPGYHNPYPQQYPPPPQGMYPPPPAPANPPYPDYQYPANQQPPAQQQPYYPNT